MELFDGFSFDTLLSIISCATGIVALIVGGTAYKNCRLLKNSQNDKKEFGDNCEDKSQKAVGNIINYNGINQEQLTQITTALSTMNNSNFSQALETAYVKFQKQCDANLAKIIEETNRIIKKEKLQIGSYSKLDWIHVYFESAKNSFDQYMQNVWAKVLAKELSAPGSFSYKSLDVLKNMSSEEFKLFEKLCSLEIGDQILEKNGFYDQFGLQYVDYLKLSEHGLLNVNSSQRTYFIEKKKNLSIKYFDKVILIMNPTDIDVDLKISIHTLTSAAKELKMIAHCAYSQENAIAFINELYNIRKEMNISLNQILFVFDNHIKFNPTPLYLVGNNT